MTQILGDLGTPRDAVDIAFPYFGLMIRVNPDATDLNQLDFMLVASEIDESNAIAAMKAMGDFLHGLIHADDWLTFWTAAKANRQQVEDLMKTAQAITEAVAAFPTGQSSDSHDGQPTTAQRSRDGSSSRGTRDTATGKALTLLKGRPDLQHAVALAQEARTAAG